VNRYESQRLAEGVSAKTVNNEVLVISGILREANLWHRVAALYKPLRVQKSDIGEALTKDEIRKLLRAARDWEGLPVAPLAAVVSCLTGMRLKEIQQLQHRSLHLDVARPFFRTLAGIMTDPDYDFQSFGMILVNTHPGDSFRLSGYVAVRTEETLVEVSEVPIVSSDTGK